MRQYIRAFVPGGTFFFTVTRYFVVSNFQEIVEMMPGR
jgi:hypothetical protein